MDKETLENGNKLAVRIENIEKHLSHLIVLLRKDKDTAIVAYTPDYPPTDIGSPWLIRPEFIRIALKLEKASREEELAECERQLERL